MKRNKITSSLMLAGVVLSSVSPLVTASAETATSQNTVPSGALTQNTPTENSVNTSAETTNDVDGVTKKSETPNSVTSVTNSSESSSNIGKDTQKISGVNENQKSATTTNKEVAADSGVSYVDGAGATHNLAIPQGASVRMNSTGTTLYIVYGIQQFVLNDVKELSLKKIIVTNLIPFYSNTVVKMSLEGVDFRKGIDISGTKSLQEVSVKDSTFGATDYSFAVHSADQLTNLNIDNSNFNADVRIYDNSNLETGKITNSTMVDDVEQHDNKIGYHTDFSNNKFDYTAGKRSISSGGKSNDDIFYINPNGKAIGSTKFNASKSGAISAKNSSGEVQSLAIPAGVNVTQVIDSGSNVKVTLSDKQTKTFDNISELTLNNANVTSTISFTSNALKLTKMTVINSRTELIDIARSNTLENVEILGTEISQSTGYLSIYKNTVLKSVTLQDTKVNGTFGYISVYDNTIMDNFVINNVYSYEYLSAYNLGGTIIKVSNSQFDDYINTNQVIEGEGDYIPTGEVPVINATDKTLKVNDKFDALKDVTATDTEDGDLTSSVKVKSNDVDTTKAGTYHVTYSVTDSDGNVAEKTITVIVATNDKPIINATDKTLKVNDKFDALKDVTATDTEDGDLTSSVKVKSNDVDTTKAGTYHVTYSVTDSNGNVAEKTITVLVNAVDTKGTVTPAVYDLSGERSVTGTYTGDVAKVQVEINGTLYPVGGTVSNGAFKYYTGVNIKTLSDKVFVIAFDKDGKQLDRKEVTIVDSVTKGTVTPAVYDLKGERSVTGTYTGDVVKVQVEINGTLYPVGGTVSNGAFKYYTGVNIKNLSDKVFVIAFDKDGKQLDRKEVTIVNSATKGTVTPATYDLSKDRSVIGTYDGDVTKIQVEINGTLYPVGGTVSNGAFKYYTGVNIKNLSDKVFVVAFDKDGKQLDRKEVTIVNSATKGTVTPATYDLSKDRSVIGTYDGDVTKIQVEINGTLYPVGGTVSNGAFKYYTGLNIRDVSDKVFVVAFDKDGKQLDRKEVTITSPTTNGTVKPSSFDVSNDSRISGTYEGDVARIRVELNGTLLTSSASAADGKFSYYIGRQIKSIQDKVYVIAYDKADKEVDRKQVDLTKTNTVGKVTPNEFSMAKDSKITGSYEGDITKIQLEVNGVLLAGGGTLSSGQFSYYVGQKITSENDKVFVVAFDKDGKQLDRKEVTLKATSGTVTPDKFVLKTSKITGTFTGDVVRLQVEVNGAKLPVGGTFTDGKFSYYVGANITKTTDKVYVLAYDKGNKELDKKLVTIVAE